MYRDRGNAYTRINVAEDTLPVLVLTHDVNGLGLIRQRACNKSIQMPVLRAFDRLPRQEPQDHESEAEYDQDDSMGMDTDPFEAMGKDETKG